MPVSLAECADAIARRPVTALRAPLDTSALERTGAACRPALRTLANADASGRDPVTAWANAEDRLANRISLLVVYYTSDPTTVDNYATAPQLWTEYDEALVVRNAALASWRSRR